MPSNRCTSTTCARVARLAGTLTIPQNRTPRAVALLITRQRRDGQDETVFGHQPFRVLADHLSRHGYAVLRLDDRGVGESSGDRSAIGPQDEADDMSAALDFLHAREDLHGLPVGLIAHSMGGVIGMMLAARRSDIAFLVTMGSPGGTLGDAFAERECDAMRTSGIDADAIARHGQFTRALYRELAERAIGIPLDAAQIAALAARFGAGGHAQRTARNGSRDSTSRGSEARVVSIRPRCSHASARRCSRSTAASMCRTLAGPNLAAIGNALAAAGHADFQTVELSALNHLFQTCKTGAVYEYPAIEETFAPLALETIRAWLDRRFPPR